MSNQGNYADFDFFSVKLVDADVTYVDVPFDTAWRILPYTVLTSIREEAGQGAGASVCEFADGETRIYAPGTTILIPRNVKHRFTNLDRPHTAIWIHWDVAIEPHLDLFRFCNVPPVIRGENSRRILEYCGEIARTDAEELSGVVRIRELLYALLGAVLNACRLREEYHNFRRSYRTCLPMINFIDANLANRLRLRDIAGFRNCSVSKMQRDFFDVFGQPIGDFIIKRRLHLASRLLASGDAGLAEIAEQTGFSDAFALSKSFRKCYGVSPGEYRRILLKPS